MIAQKNLFTNSYTYYIIFFLFVLSLIFQLRCWCKYRKKSWNECIAAHRASYYHLVLVYVKLLVLPSSLLLFLSRRVQCCHCSRTVQAASVILMCVFFTFLSFHHSNVNSQYIRVESAHDATEKEKRNKLFHYNIEAFALGRKRMYIRLRRHRSSSKRNEMSKKKKYLPRLSAIILYIYSNRHQLTI